MSLMQEMSQRALDLGVPMSVHFDITYRCNERCVHCYLDHDDHGEMTTAEIKRVLDELADAGNFFLTFSGGEVSDAARFLRASGIRAPPDVRRENQNQRRHDSAKRKPGACWNWASTRYRSASTRTGRRCTTPSPSFRARSAGASKRSAF